MSLERQDIRAKLDADVHEALLAICDAKGLTVGEFVERLLVPEITRLVHEANVIAARLQRTPAPGKHREIHSQIGGAGRK